MLQQPTPANAHEGRTEAYDVIVIGGGMAGCAAALAAARTEARVLLVEQNAFLGGAATAGMVGQFVGWRTRAGREVIRGIAADIVEQLRAEGGCGDIHDFVMSTGHVMNRIEYDAEILKIVLEQMLIAAGVDILFKAVMVGSSVTDGRVTGVDIWASGLVLRALAPVFVDASGDMSLLVQAGAGFLGLEPGQALQPGTMMFAMAPVDFAALDAVTGEARERIVRKGLAEGALPRAALHHSRVPGTQVAWFNISRVSVDPDDPFSVSRGEVEGRRQALTISRFLTANLPGCSAARLSALAPQLGIRDTRRARGEHVLTRDELVEGVRFADAIAAGAYPIDVHIPDSAELAFIEFNEDHHYCIPYRSLVPLGLRNVLTAGRGISASHEAFAALRVMPTAMAMGHAAGLGAALAANGTQGDVRAVDVAALRVRLTAEHAYLG